MTSNRLPDIETLTLASMRRLEGEQYQAAVGMDPRRLMGTLKIGLYFHRATNSHWFALTDERIHDHDRWLLACSHTRKGKNTWFRIKVSDVPVPHHTVELLAGSALGVYKTLDFYRINAESINAERVRLGMPELGADQTIALRRTTGAHATAQLNLMPAGLAAREAHEMLHHYEAWAKGRGLDQTLPRDLTLRMHGLGPILDARREGLV